MGERVLIDTDSLIDYYREKLELNPEDTYHISEITAYELVRGTKDIEETKRMIEESFTIIWLDNRIMIKASQIWRDLKKKGELVEDRDLLIGATAIVGGLRLFTGNAGHYDKLRQYELNFYR